MLSYALSTGTHLASCYFHLPFDEEEDKDIESYERKSIAWPLSAETTRSRSAETSPVSSGPSSPSSSNASLLSACSSSASLSSMGSARTPVPGAPTYTTHSRSTSETPTSPSASASSSKSRSEPQSPQPHHTRSASSPPLSTSSFPNSKGKAPASNGSLQADSLIQEIVRDNDLYSILGVPSQGALDKTTLRRAYLARSRLCHPDKFPSNPDATLAFQKVSIAYDVLSTPHSRRRYDEHRASLRRRRQRSGSFAADEMDFDVFASARPTGYAEDTLRSVILGVFNDFLDNGDLEVIRGLLKVLNEMNPGVKIGDDGVRAVLSTLHSIRERALTCRTCIYTLHGELTRLLEVQHSFSQLSYFDILGRTRMAVQLSRIAVGLPMVLEKALLMEWEAKERVRGGEMDGEQYVDVDGRARRKQRQRDGGGETESVVAEGVFPRHVMLVVRGVDVALESMERILKR